MPNLHQLYNGTNAWEWCISFFTVWHQQILLASSLPPNPVPHNLATMDLSSFSVVYFPCLFIWYSFVWNVFLSSLQGIKLLFIHQDPDQCLSYLLSFSPTIPGILFCIFLVIILTLKYKNYLCTSLTRLNSLRINNRSYLSLHPSESDIQ